MPSAGGGGAVSGFLWPPINPHAAKQTRIDQGVDYVSSAPYVAVADGTVVHIDPNFYNGTPAVYVKLDKPVSVNGRTYGAVYSSETRSLVTVGQRVKAGQAITAPGNGEIGFAQKFGVGWLPAAHYSFTGENQTQAGGDFASAVAAAVFTSGGGPDQTPGTTTTVSGPSGTTTSSGPPVSGGLIGALDSIAKAFEFLVSIRFLEVLGGAILPMIGLYLLARNVGLAQTPELANLPGAHLSDQAAAEMQFSPGRASYRRPSRRSSDLSEAGERRAAIRKRAEGAEPSNDIPF